MDSSSNPALIALPTPDAISQAAEYLRQGNLVGVPTETVYGLAADATNDDAVSKIFAAKNRPANNPLIIHVASSDQARRWTCVDQPSWLSDQFDAAAALWPGPLTVVVPRGPLIADKTTAGGETIGVRVPNHSVALALLQQCDFPLAAPSANRSNYISPTSAMHVATGLGDRVSMVLEGGPCETGLESTIIKLDANGPRLLRPGGLSVEQLETCFGVKIILPDLQPVKDSGITSGPLSSPGQLAKHYSPTKPLQILGGDTVPDDLSKVGRIAFAPLVPSDEAMFGRVWTLSQDGNLADVAKSLFAALREADQSDMESIVIDRCQTVGIGLAIMDRINRAASSS